MSTNQDAAEEDPPATTEEEEPDVYEARRILPKPRQWLIDRTNGTSKNEGGRPFCPLCWVPPPVKYLPDILEQNACCEGYGKIGAFPHDHGCSRIWLMRKSLLVHLGGLILSILACLAITSDPTMLKNFAFSSGAVTGSIAERTLQRVEMYIGLTSVHVDDAYFGPRTYGLDELCTFENVGIPLTSLSDCHTCSDASRGLVLTVILGVITYIPSMASNINRAYYNYDVNCQKVFGTLVALLNMLMSLYTWKGYANKCFQNFYDGEVIIPVLVPKNESEWGVSETGPLLPLMNLSAFEEQSKSGFESSNITVEVLFPNVNATLLAMTDTRLARVDFDWSPGLGLILVVVATFLKLIDILNNMLIKTPKITRSLQEQLDYEKKYGAESIRDADDAAETGDAEVTHEAQ